MTITIFISGSRHIRHLAYAVKLRLDNIIAKQFQVVVGDANGADKAVQQYLAERDYAAVRVYCSGGVCRNNLGQWPVEWIKVNPALKGRAFYTVKDEAMSEAADYGFVLWDGKSQGSLNNMKNLLARHCNVLLWLAPEKAFYTLTDWQQLQTLREIEIVEQQVSVIQHQNVISHLALQLE